MAKIELELNEETLQRARQSAEASHATLEHWLTETIERTAATTAPDALLGLFSDAPDLVDAVTENAMTAREGHQTVARLVAVENDTPTSVEIARLSLAGGAFDWLADEPDLYDDTCGEAIH